MTTSRGKTDQAALSAQPGTQRYLAQAIGGEQHPKISMPGLPTVDGLGFRAYNSDSSWLGYQMSARAGTAHLGRSTLTVHSSLRPASKSVTASPSA